MHGRGRALAPRSPVPARTRRRSAAPAPHSGARLRLPAASAAPSAPRRPSEPRPPSRRAPAAGGGSRPARAGLGRILSAVIAFRLGRPRAPVSAPGPGASRPRRRPAASPRPPVAASWRALRRCAEREAESRACGAAPLRRSLPPEAATAARRHRPPSGEGRPPQATPEGARSRPTPLTACPEIRRQTNFAAPRPSRPAIEAAPRAAGRGRGAPGAPRNAVPGRAPGETRRGVAQNFEISTSCEVMNSSSAGLPASVAAIPRLIAGPISSGLSTRSP